MSLSFHVPVYDVPDVPQIHVPFNPCSYISCPLSSAISLKLKSLSMHVPVFHVPDDPQIPVPFYSHLLFYIP